MYVFLIYVLDDFNCWLYCCSFYNQNCQFYNGFSCFADLQGLNGMCVFFLFYVSDDVNCCPHYYSNYPAFSVIQRFFCWSSVRCNRL
jgi:hypothetical protein